MTNGTIKIAEARHLLANELKVMIDRLDFYLTKVNKDDYISIRAHKGLIETTTENVYEIIGYAFMIGAIETKEKNILRDWVIKRRDQYLDRI